MIVIGTAKTAELIRVMRANLLDELNKPYVATARAKGLPEGRLLLKYPVRMALNPFVSTVGWVLPSLISGAVIAAVVLNLPTAGPLLLNALKSQDMYLAGSFILMLSALTVIGTLDLRPPARVARSAHPPAVSRPMSAIPDDVRIPARRSRRGRTHRAAERYQVAGQWRLMWWRFRRHKVAVLAGIIVARDLFRCDLCRVPGADRPQRQPRRFTYAPPQALHLFDRAPDGTLQFGLHVYGYKSKIDPRTLRRTFVADPDNEIPLGFFVKGDALPAVGTAALGPAPDRPRRPARSPSTCSAPTASGATTCRGSSTARASRMSIGLVGVALSLILGIDPRRRLRLFRRTHRRPDPAHHRVPALDADHPAVDGPRRGDPADLAAARRLLHDHHPPLADRLDDLAREVRGKVMAQQERGFRHRRPARRRPAVPDHQAPAAARLRIAHHRRRRRWRSRT